MDTVTQTDTPGTQQTAAPDTQSNMTIVTNPGSTRLDEILSDLSGGNKASDPPAATTAAPATSTAPPANGSQTTDPPAPRAQPARRRPQPYPDEGRLPQANERYR
jgi:hypothetical protein